MAQLTRGDVERISESRANHRRELAQDKVVAGGKHRGVEVLVRGEVLERIRMRDADGASAAVFRLLDVALHDLEHNQGQVGEV